MRILIFFHLSGSELILSVTSSLLLTSKFRVITSVFLLSLFLIFESLSSLLPQRIKLYLLDNKLAAASPIPEVAPVINIIFFELFRSTFKSKEK